MRDEKRRTRPFGAGGQIASGARRALEIAAAGAHNLLMSGPPGTGKTMLASRLPGILPPMTRHEALEAASALLDKMAYMNYLIGG